MTSGRGSVLLLAAFAFGGSVHGAEGPPALRIVAPTNQSMPVLRMAGALPAEGLVKDVGEVLAERLGLGAVFVPLPSKRAGPALATGTADLICYVKPGWLEDGLLWTRAFLPGAGIIAAHPSAPPVAALHALRDEPLGTVLGYRYPVLDQAFMRAPRREDVPDAVTNLRRLAAGRVRYAVTDRAALAFFLRDHPASGLREAIEVERYELGCALSPGKAALLEPLNRAIDRMRVDGSLQALLDRYR